MPIDQYSAASIYIETICNQNNLGQATGFLFERDDRMFLISNWHVLSGRDPASGRPRIKSGAVPDEVRVWFYFPAGNEWRDQIYRLYDNANNARWIQHPNGQDVDLAALEIAVPNGAFQIAINSIAEQANLAVNVSDAVFIIGFPLGIAAGGRLPVWKRASIASEPDLNPYRPNTILVDTQSREGMSGSPVVRRESGSFIDVNGGLRVIGGVHSKLIGVYSGRLGVGEVEAQLGITWKRFLIDEMLTNPTLGDFTLRT